MCIWVSYKGVREAKSVFAKVRTQKEGKQVMRFIIVGLALISMNLWAADQSVKIVFRDGSFSECSTDCKEPRITFEKLPELPVMKPVRDSADPAIDILPDRVFLVFYVTKYGKDFISDLADVKEVTVANSSLGAAPTERTWTNKDIKEEAYSLFESVRPQRPKLSLRCDPKRVENWGSNWPDWAANQPKKKYDYCNSKDVESWEQYERALSNYEVALQYLRERPHSRESTDSKTPTHDSTSNCVSVPNADNPLTSQTYCAPRH